MWATHIKFHLKISTFDLSIYASNGLCGWSVMFSSFSPCGKMCVYKDKENKTNTFKTESFTESYAHFSLAKTAAQMPKHGFYEIM